MSLRGKYAPKQAEICTICTYLHQHVHQFAPFAQPFALWCAPFEPICITICTMSTFCIQLHDLHHHLHLLHHLHQFAQFAPPYALFASMCTNFRHLHQCAPFKLHQFLAYETIATNFYHVHQLAPISAIWTMCTICTNMHQFPAIHLFQILTGFMALLIAIVEQVFRQLEILRGLVCSFLLMYG